MSDKVIRFLSGKPKIGMHVENENWGHQESPSSSHNRGFEIVNMDYNKLDYFCVRLIKKTP